MFKTFLSLAELEVRSARVVAEPELESGRQGSGCVGSNRPLGMWLSRERPGTQQLRVPGSPGDVLGITLDSPITGAIIGLA